MWFDFSTRFCVLVRSCCRDVLALALDRQRNPTTRHVHLIIPYFTAANNHTSIQHLRTAFTLMQQPCWLLSTPSIRLTHTVTASTAL